MYLIVSGPYEGRKIRWVWGEGGGKYMIKCGGYINRNIPLVEIGLIDLPKSGGAMALTALSFKS